MHTVHNPSIDSEDDWEPRVYIPNQPHVLRHLADRWFSEVTSEPVVRVNFPDEIHGHLHDREVPGRSTSRSTSHASNPLEPGQK